jgi:predicted nucleic-acid-binding protein
VLSSVDTNILLRRIVRDDPGQFDLVKAHFASNQIMICPTVLLETVWVLASYYKWPRGRIHEAMEALIDLENVSVPDTEGTRWVLDRYASGADFADMMHVTGSRFADQFVTFDAKLARQAGPDAEVQILPLGT